MPKVKMNTTYAGPSGSAQPGKTITVTEQEAKDLIAGKYATAIEPVETAVAAPPPENTAGRRGRAPRAAAAVPPPDQLPRM